MFEPEPPHMGGRDPENNKNSQIRSNQRSFHLEFVPQRTGWGENSSLRTTAVNMLYVCKMLNNEHCGKLTRLAASLGKRAARR